MNKIYNAMLYCYCYMQTIALHIDTKLFERRTSRASR